MSYKKYYTGLTLLLLIFAYLFIQILIASYKIESSVQKIRQTGTVSGFSHHVIFISQELDNPYWKTIEKGARSAAKKFNMQLEYIGPIQMNLKEQLDYFNKAIAAKADAIIVQGAEGPEFAALMNKAKAQGIPVITVDTDAPSSKRLTYVGTDNIASGEKLGRLVVHAVKRNGKIGVIIGSSTAENHKQRLQGLLSVINKYPNIQVVDIQSSNISRIQATQQAEKIIEKNPDINVIVGTSALDGVGIVQAVKGLKKEGIQVFGFDDLPETRTAIAKGEIQAAIVQQPYKMGYYSIQLLDQFFKKQKVLNEHFTEIRILNRRGIQ